MMTLVRTQHDNNIYASDLNDKFYSFSKCCKHCGSSVDILDNTGICWLSPDMKHHPSFRLLDKSEVTL